MKKQRRKVIELGWAAWQKKKKTKTEPQMGTFKWGVKGGTFPN